MLQGLIVGRRSRVRIVLVARALLVFAAIPSATAAKSSRHPFSAHGSAEQVYVTGLGPLARMSLISPSGRTLYTQRADSLGGLLFRNVPPGRGYRVRLD